MDNALGAWIVTAVVFAGAALLVLLVKHWTGWDPREARPSQSRAPRPTELNELERINKDFGESFDTEREEAKNPELVRKFVSDRDSAIPPWLDHLEASVREHYNEANERDILAAVAQYNLAAMYTDALPRTEVVSKMWGYIKKRKLQNEANKRKIPASAEIEHSAEIYAKSAKSLEDVRKMFDEEDLADTSDRSSALTLT